MSSESSSGSSSSRIRQFGLYRSIDARTEEFLRLSMKRQIRQGCACAAVSTAITITVVVVVFVVYEFSLNPEINLESSIKVNWLNLMNATNDGQTFEANVQRNVDHGTLQLLPMLIKAYKKNAILEKVIEYSSANPLSDKKFTTEDYEYKKSIFTKNWLKLPTSKLFTIEYKTSPVVYYRTPKENLKYFTKIRKIRDDQRIIEYVDKMINEKSTIGSTKPMIKAQLFTITEVTPKITVTTSKTTLKPTTTTQFTQKPSPRTKQTPKITQKPTLTQIPTIKQSLTKHNTTMKETKTKCKCAQSIGTLLKKILNSIRNVMPKNTTLITPQRQQSKESVSLALNKTELKTTTQITTIKPTTIVPSPLKLYFSNESNVDNLEINQRDRTTTANLQLIEGTENDDIIVPKMTKPMKHYYDSRYLESESNDISMEQIIARKRLAINGDDLQVKKKTKFDTNIKRQHIFTNNNRNKYSYKYGYSNDYITKPTATPNFLKDLNNALYKLIEQNVKMLSHSLTTEPHITSTRPPEINEHTNRISSPSPLVSSTFTEVIETSTEKCLETSTEKYIKTSTEKYIENDAKNAITTKKEITNEEIASTTAERVVTPKYSPSSLISPLTSSFALPLTSTLISPLATPFKMRKLLMPLAPKATTDLPMPKLEEINWEELKIEDVPAWKSMMPINRPVYLEIHRNDLKRQEDPSEFEYNIINNNYAAYEDTA